MYSLIVPEGNVVFTRKYLAKMPDFSKSSKMFSKVEVHEKGSIEDDMDALQADFANAFIGGGAISYGCVQEEIRFCINPECIVSRLFCYVMNENEAIVIKGAEQFSKYTGYAQSLGYGGDYVDKNVDEKGNIKTTIVAIDALIFQGRVLTQWQPKFLVRELNKAFVSFEGNELKRIATGNWGCGAFMGDKELKSILQWIACVEANQKMVYFTFGDANLSKNLTEITEWIVSKKISVGALYKCLLEMHKTNIDKIPSTFAFIQKHFK